LSQQGSTTASFKASDFYRAPTVTPASGRRILNLLETNGFFAEVRPASGRRAATLAFKELLNLAEGRAMF